jgi:hypothetical protein
MICFQDNYFIVVTSFLGVVLTITTFFTVYKIVRFFRNQPIKKTNYLHIVPNDFTNEFTNEFVTVTL